MCSSQHGLQPTRIPTRVFSTIAGAGGPEANTNCPVSPTWSCHNSCHGKAIRNPFSHGDDVRQDTVGLEAPEVRAQPSEPCLHLMEASSKLLETFKKCWFSDLFTFIISCRCLRHLCTIMDKALSLCLGF